MPITRLAAAALLCAAPLAALAAPDCALGSAVYTPVVEPGDADADYSAEMRPARPQAGNMAPVVLVMRKASGESYSFRFHAPNGYGRLTVGVELPPRQAGKKASRKAGSGEDDGAPTSTAQFFDARMIRVETLFDDKARAPAFMSLPDLGLGFWYWPAAARTFVPPAGLWRLERCRT